MTKRKTTLLDKTYTSFIDMVLSDVPMGHLDKVVAHDVMGFGTTVDEKIHDLKGLRDLAILQREQSADLKFNYEVTPVFRKIMNQQSTAIIVDEIKMTIQGKEEKMELQLRLSTILDFIDDNWKVVHWHGSKPDYDSGGSDPWHREEWQKKNEELQKLVEENTADLILKNRELEIESSLERVRAVAMSMQKPDDLLDVCEIISDQLELLNISDIRNIQVAIVNESKKTYLNYQYFTPYSKLVFEETEYNNNPTAYAMVMEMKKTANTFFSGEMKAKELKDFKEWRKKYDQFPDPIMDKSPAVYYYFYSIGKGGLGLTTYQAISDEEHEIFKRFHKVFEQTYTRFLDLQKAEAQIREARIEAALEKVRSRSIGMQKSEELREVIQVIHDQLIHLNFEIDAAGFTLDYHQNNDWNTWIANKSASLPSLMFIPYIDHPQFNYYKSAKEKGLDFLANTLSFEEKNSIFNYMFGFMGDYPQVEKDEVLRKPGLAISQAFLKNISLWIYNLEAIPYSDEDNSTLMRFAKVFQQTYTRFLDLQKAETQARESHIEAALERVRARSMAMHKSEELAALSLELVKQVQALGVATWFCAFNIYDKDPKGSLEWGSNGQGTFPEYRTPREGIFRRYYEAGQSGETLHVNEIDENECPRHYDYLCSLPGVGEQLLKMRDSGISFPTSQIDHVAYFKYGYLLFITFEPADDTHDIFKRFAKVFEQTYTRFLDLKKAEEQARESKIEAALERARAQSMMMQHSSELNKTSQVFHEQLHLLGIESEFSYLWLPNENHAEHLFWATWQEKEQGQSTYKNKQVVYPLDKTEPSIAACYVAWESGNNVHINPVKAEGIENYFNEWSELLEGVHKFNPQNYPEGLYYVDAYMKYGCFGIMIRELLSDDEQHILDRFSKEFERAYTRFLDLTKAEEQAREAKIETALERVRSKAMAMHNSEDLGLTVDTFFSELKGLNVTPHRCGLGIIDKENKISSIQAIDANDGKGLKKVIGDLKLSGHPVLNQIFENWELQKEYHPVLQGKEIMEYYQVMNPQVKFNEFADDEVQYGYYFYFKEGIVFAWTDQKLPERDLQIFRRYSSVLSLTYRRYLDLKDAESQAMEAQVELALERIRAQVTAMSESADLLDIVVMMQAEFTRLGHEAHYFWHMRWLQDKYEKALTNGDGTRIGNVMELPRGFHGIQEMLDWENTNEPSAVFALDTETGADYIDKMIKMGRFQEIDHSAPGPDEVREMGGLTFVMARTTHGEIGYTLPGEVPNPPEKDVATLVRFAGVFDLAYRRFVDLKNAERRNRETQIELALERVRARTMAMHTSEELSNVASVLFEQMKILGGDLFAFGIVLCDKYEDMVEQWHSIGEEGMMSPFQIPVDLDHIHQYRYDQWKSGEPLFFIEIPEDYISKHFELMFEVPSFEASMSEVAAKGINISTPSWEIDYGASFSHGYLLVSSLTPFKENYIFTRFAKVFEQAYTRFLDLQKAEAQGREATIEAALERVRARALAMQQPEELKDVAQVMRQEMGQLGVEELETSSIYINDEIDYQAECWYAIKDVRDHGKTLVNDYFSLNLKDTSVGREMLQFYKSEQQQVSIVMAGEARNEWIRYCEEKSVALRGYYGEVIPERTYHLYKFSHGAIGAATPGDFSTESWGLLKRAAAVFSLAYSRFKDLTQAKSDLQHLKEEKKRAEDALSNLKSTQTQLIHAEKMASLGELTAGIAHEIQNPLNFVNNFSEVNKELLLELIEEIESGNLDDVKDVANDVIENEEKITHHGKRAEAIVKGMLQHSRSSVDDKEPTDINALADEYLRLSYHGLRAKDKSFNADFKTEFDDMLPKINVISQDIGRVLLNLINNAFYACNKQSRYVIEKSEKENETYKPLVSVMTAYKENKVIISVKDNGGGIPPDVLSKIFQPFFTTKPAGEGTGLGLSLSYDIITKGHGGKLEVETKEGIGTEFIIYLNDKKKIDD